MKPKSFADWAAAGGHIPKGINSKEWDKTVKKYAGGGLLKKAIKSLAGAQEVLPQAERQANLAKLLEPSKVKERLYHGTMASEGGKGQEAIRRLKPSKEGALGSGVYLTPQSEFASTYAGFPARSQLERDIATGSDFAKESAGQLLDRMNRGAIESHEIGGNMLPVYAQLKNPLILEGKGDPMIEALVKLGVDEATARRMVERAYETKGYIGREVESRARAAGYDGLMQYHDGNLSEVVSYNPNAIKSATGNVGTYDVTSPDLSKAGGGLAKMTKLLKGKQEVLPAAQREANLQKMLEPSAVKQRMYHGSSNPNIKQLKTGKMLKQEQYPGNTIEPWAVDNRDAVFLTPEPKFSQKYSGDEWEISRGQSPTTYPVYVQAQRPWDYDNPAHIEEAIQAYKQKFPLKKDKSGAVPSDESMRHHRFEKSLRGLSSRENNWSGIENAELQEVIRGLGFDSFYVQENGLKNLGVYDPNKIKSAIGNRGTYDINDPDLNKAGGGEVKMQDGGAAFGVFPQMKGKRTKQDREAAKTFPLDVARGFVAGSLGAPADILNIPAAVYSLATGKDMPYEVPYGSEHFQKILPGKPTTPTGEAASGLGALAGGFYTGPGSGIRAAMAVPKAAVKAGKDFIMAAPQGAPRMFIGPKAKTWDQAKADRAAQMEKEGKDPVDIWRETGTFRSADGILRQEISDVGAVHRNPTQLKELGKQKKEEAAELQQRLVGIPGQKDMFPKALTEAKKPAREKVKTLKEEADELMRHSDVRGQRAKFALEHPELYKAYPELGEIPVYQGNRGIGGERASIRGGPQDMEMEITQSGLRGDPRSSALHEMQHAIQTIEGMGPGGSPAMAFKNPKAFEILEELRKKALEPMTFEEYAKQYSHVPDLQQGYESYKRAIPRVVKNMDRELQQQAAMEYYKRLSGEAEARATQAREPLTQSQRAIEFPYSSYDVLPEDLIVNSPKSGGLSLQTVYHGSPHKFEKFDASKIGTGEGAQAYGHGLYFAESPNVASTYASMRSPMPRLYKDGKPFEAKTHAEMLAEARALGAGSIDEAIERQTSKLQGSKKNEQGVVLLEETGRSIEEERLILDALRTFKAEGYQPGAGGHLYTVDLPDEKIARMIDWDKPLSEQPEVIKALKGTDYEVGLSQKEAEKIADQRLRQEAYDWADETGGDPVDFINNANWERYVDQVRKESGSVDSNITGKELHRMIMRDEGYRPDLFDPENYQVGTSEALRGYGIPGVKYLDATSRQAGEGTRNFVVFPGEEDALTILERKKEGGEVKMAEGGAAFGVFPQMKGRRSKQDPEAAKTFPIDVARGFVSGALGMPGDIESIVRMLPGFSEKTILPTSEDIEKRLPLRSDTPAARAATGLGQIGGGFYTGPLSGARAAVAVPKAVMQAGRDFVQAAGQPAVNVIKPKGGNWLTGNIEKQVGRMKMADEMTPEYYANRQRALEEARVKGDDRTVRAISEDLEVSRRNDAINNWIDRNLTNYIKKEMATPEDPVRRLAEEGILHIKPFGDQGVVSSRLQNKRMGAGFSLVGEGKSEAAKFWERQADISIDPYPAGSYKHGTLDEGLLEANPWLKNVPDEQMINYAKGINDLGFDHIVDVLRQDVRAGRIRPEQLSKVSMEQAVRRTYEFDQEMAKKMRDAQIKATEGMPVVKEYPEGYKWVDLTVPKLESLPEGTSYQKLSNGQVRIVDAGGNPLTAGERSEAAALKSLEKQRGQELLEGALKYEGETMGHCVGGYCPDVLEGRSRIYSLRDAKGEPHVTIEVRPIEDMARERIEPAISEFGQKGYRVEDQFFLNKDEALAYVLDDIRRFEPNIKPEIIQIKGKQNKAPNEEYLPFVQDFVRSGQWSEVGDFANTGLIKIDPHSDLAKGLTAKGVSVPSYVSSNELTGLLKQAEVGSYVNPSRGETFINPNHPDWADNGMKRGGEVKMQAGGIAKTLKKLVGPSAEAVAKDVSAAERAAAGRMAADVTKATQPMKMSEALGNLNVEGKGKVKITQSDRTKVGGGNIGGAMFPGLSQVDPLYEGLVWGVGKKPTASSLINQSDDLTYWTTILGAEDQLKTNPIVFNKLRQGFVDAMKQGKLDKELEGKINRNLSLTFGEGADIRDPKIWRMADTFEKRAALADIMLGQGIPPSKGGVALGGEKSGKGVIFKPTDILKRETEPLLLHPEHGGSVPTFAVGPRLFQFSGGMKVRPDLHPGFPVLLEGQDLGMVFRPAPGEVAMRDFTQRMASERGRKPGYYEWTMGEKGKGLPSQDITEEYLTYLQKAGYAKGGKVGALSQAKNQRNK